MTLKSIGPSGHLPGRAVAMSGVAALLCIACVGLQAQAAPTAAAASASPDAASVMRPLDKLGIEFIGLQLTAENYMIGLRYRVKDVARSRVLTEKNVQPVLVNEANGERYYVPQVPLRRGAQRPAMKANAPVGQPGKVYSILFANPDRKLRAGEKVTLYAGETVLKGIEVR